MTKHWARLFLCIQSSLYPWTLTIVLSLSALALFNKEAWSPSPNMLKSTLSGHHQDQQMYPIVHHRHYFQQYMSIDANEIVPLLHHELNAVMCKDHLDERKRLPSFFAFATALFQSLIILQLMLWFSTPPTLNNGIPKRKKEKKLFTIFLFPPPMMMWPLARCR